MSRQRSRQEKASKSVRSPPGKFSFSEPLPPWSSTRRTVIYAILSLILSGIFIYQITRADSMLGGIMGWELQKINGNRPGQITWKDLGDEYRREAAQMPDYKAHEAVRQLLIVVDYVHRGRLDASRVLDQAKIWAAEDSDNLVSRLALAYLADKAQGGAASAQQRFENAKRIIDGEKKPSQATLHQDTFNRKWYEILKRHISREDVAISAARHVRVEEQRHIAALPMLKAWLNDVAADLFPQNKTAEIELCNSWITRSLSGIIDAEPDASTRLLGIELLQKSLPKSATQQSLCKLHDDFHSQADASPIDMIDIYKTPTPLPELYRRSRAFLFAVLAMACACNGIIIFIAVISGVNLVQKIRASNERYLKIQNPWYGALCSAGFLIIFISVPILGGFCYRSIVSELSISIIAIDLVFAGAFVALLGAHRCTEESWRQVAILLCVFLLLLGFSYTPVHLWQKPIRTLDLNAPAPLIIALGLLLGLILFVAISRLSLASICQVGFRTMTGVLVVALLLLCLHKACDRSYRDNVVSARMDEFSARLGPNWKSKYFGKTAALQQTTQP